MINRNLVGTLAVAALFVTPLAHATQIHLTFDYTGVSGVADITATDLGGGSYLATSGTLTVTGGPGGTWSILPVGPAAVWSPNGGFNVDDLVLPGADPVLTVSGLLFGDGSPSLELNLWGDSAGNYSLYTGTGPGAYPYTYTGPMTVSVTVGVPDGGFSLALLGAGLAGLGILSRRRLS